MRRPGLAFVGLRSWHGRVSDRTCPQSSWSQISQPPRASNQAPTAAANQLLNAEISLPAICGARSNATLFASTQPRYLPPYLGRIPVPCATTPGQTMLSPFGLPWRAWLWPWSRSKTVEEESPGNWSSPFAYSYLFRLSVGEAGAPDGEGRRFR